MKVKNKIILTLMFIVLNSPCFGQNNLMQKSKSIYDQLDSYSADFVLQVHDEGQFPRKGTVLYKSPNLLRIEVKYKEIEMLTILDGKYYFAESKTISTGRQTIVNAGGVLGKTVELKKGDPYYSVMVFGETLRETIKEKYNYPEEDFKRGDLLILLSAFQPGTYYKEAIFPFHLLDAYYSIVSTDDKQIIATAKESSSKIPLPVKVIMYFTKDYFISKIETFDSNDSLQEEIEYTNIKVNIKVDKGNFEYKIPPTALVTDIESNIKNSAK
jgi:outer membrane lipoprotein-sorting protein